MRGRVKSAFMKYLALLQAVENVQAHRENLRIYAKQDYQNVGREKPKYGYLVNK